VRLLVTGGRDYDDAGTVVRVLDRALARMDSLDAGLVIVHGACRVRAGGQWDHGDPEGLDGMAHRWAVWRRLQGYPVDVEPHPADYSGAYCLGPARNARMVLLGADACVAFPGGAGTADCTRRAREAGIRVGIVARNGVLSWE
jgi:hypothetical protein